MGMTECESGSSLSLWLWYREERGGNFLGDRFDKAGMVLLVVFGGVTGGLSSFGSCGADAK